MLYFWKAWDARISNMIYILTERPVVLSNAIFLSSSSIWIDWLYKFSPKKVFSNFISFQWRQSERYIVIWYRTSGIGGRNKREEKEKSKKSILIFRERREKGIFFAPVSRTQREIEKSILNFEILNALLQFERRNGMFYKRQGWVKSKTVTHSLSEG